MIDIFEHPSWGPTSMQIWVGGQNFSFPTLFDSYRELLLRFLITSTLRYYKGNLPHKFEKMTQLRNISFGDEVLQYDLFYLIFFLSHLALAQMRQLAITFDTSL